MIIVDLFIVFVLVTAALTGSRRGVKYLFLELICLAAATAGALSSYAVIGSIIQGFAPVTAPAANVIGFFVLWLLIEIGLSLVVRHWVVPRMHRLRISPRLSSSGGAALSLLKAAIIIFALLWITVGAPIPTKIKRAILDSAIPNLLIDESAVRDWWAADGLGRDLRESFSFSVNSTENKFDKSYSLGFTTTDIRTNEAAEKQLLVLINRDRSSAGLEPLTVNTKARAVARDYAREMLAAGYFSHIDARGNDASFRLRDGNVFFDAAGENLAYAPTVELAHDNLMGSPEHRANILSSAYRAVGIGVIDAGLRGLMIVENFTD